ncbi:MAG: DUF3800 domain-containing protein [Elusimicrobiales bacterium]
MAYFLFLDESGGGHTEGEYEVLGGIAVEDVKLWGFIQDAHNLELEIFGRRYTDGDREIKGKKLLKKKVFTHAKYMEMIAPGERTVLAKKALDNGPAATRKELAALAQAKLCYVNRLFRLCITNKIKAFASIVAPDAPGTPEAGILRKDYSYLFERFFYFLEDAGHSAGIVVFDELEKIKSHILITQMESYYQKTAKGKQRATRIIPEPFFVHSHLTTCIQVADLVDYVLGWTWKVDGVQTKRPELEYFQKLVFSMRHKIKRSRLDIFSFSYIRDLRCQREMKKAM